MPAAWLAQRSHHPPAGMELVLPGLDGISRDGSAASCGAFPFSGTGVTSHAWAVLRDGTGRTGQCPEVTGPPTALERGRPERVTRRAPPSLYSGLLLGDLPGSPCWLCPSQTKTAGAFQTAASQKVGCGRAGLCWHLADPGHRRTRQRIGAVAERTPAAVGSPCTWVLCPFASVH